VTQFPVEFRSVVPVTSFRALMTKFPSGVAVVTTLDAEGKPWGMTCSSVCSVTPNPPTLLICLRDASPTLNAVLERATFTVNLLHNHAQPIAELFASGAPDRFDRVQWDVSPTAGGPHLSPYTTATADCRVSDTERVGDHVVVFGEIYQVSERSGNVPLLYGLRRYSAWPDHDGNGHSQAATMS
jgi:flavin reductase (DIM6/NTAB) family NADH-FMN oxidoreductase RutF